MSCSEILPVIQDFVDHELADEDMLRVEQHLGDCESCSEVVGSLRDMKACLRQHARPGPAPAGLLERVGRELRGEVRSGGLRWRQLALVAVLLLAVTGTIWLGVLPETAAASPLAQAAVEVHLDRIHTGKMGRLTGNCEEVEELFRQQLHLSAHLPRFSAAADIDLKGACLTRILERRSAIAFYDYQGRRVTMFLMDCAGLDTAQLDAAQAESAELICMREEYEGYQIICWKREGALFALVAERSQPDLGDLIASAYK